MARILAVALACALASCSAAALAGPSPNPALTPGARNPAVTQSNIAETVCVRGWTATVRPPTSFTNKLKRQQIAEYGYADKTLSDYEEDHLISLELGGNPTDPKNLWPEPWGGSCGARVKDALETKLKNLVCANKMTLSKARRLIAGDWIAAYRRYVKPAGC